MPGNPLLTVEDEKLSITKYVRKQLDFSEYTTAITACGSQHSYDLCGAESSDHLSVENLVHRLGRFKVLGNTAFQRGKYVEAEQCYQIALKGY